MNLTEPDTAGLWKEEARTGLVFSGHESFAMRYGWVPKLYEAVTSNPEVFSSDERAILTLGLGRNMVKSIRFWGSAFGLTTTDARRTVATPFAKRLLDPVTGADPYLEDAASLWRLHWVATVHGGLGAWATTFLDLQDTEISRDRLTALVIAKAMRNGSSISSSTAAAHVDIMLRTYDGGRPAAGPILEDALGCPLQELDLLHIAVPAGTTTVRISRGAKPALDVAAMAFALADFWSGTAPGSRILSLRSLMLARRAPGAVFRLDEASLHERLDALCSASAGLTLRDDGAGGVDLVATRGSASAELERMAW